MIPPKTPENTNRFYCTKPDLTHPTETIPHLPIPTSAPEDSKEIKLEVSKKEITEVTGERKRGKTGDDVGRKTGEGEEGMTGESAGEKTVESDGKLNQSNLEEINEEQVGEEETKEEKLEVGTTKTADYQEVEKPAMEVEREGEKKQKQEKQEIHEEQELKAPLKKEGIHPAQRVNTRKFSPRPSINILNESMKDPEPISSDKGASSALNVKPEEPSKDAESKARDQSAAVKTESEEGSLEARPTEQPNKEPGTRDNIPNPVLATPVHTPGSTTAVGVRSPLESDDGWILVEKNKTKSTRTEGRRSKKRPLSPSSTKSLKPPATLKPPLPTSSVADTKSKKVPPPIQLASPSSAPLTPSTSTPSTAKKRRRFAFGMGLSARKRKGRATPKHSAATPKSTAPGTPSGSSAVSLSPLPSPLPPMAASGHHEREAEKKDRVLMEREKEEDKTMGRALSRSSLVSQAVATPKTPGRAEERDERKEMEMEVEKREEKVEVEKEREEEEIRGVSKEELLARIQ
eukprot:202626-Amorphochlora_amoeboformis.AAC.1